jgi:hypothetical protein
MHSKNLFTVRRKGQAFVARTINPSAAPGENEGRSGTQLDPNRPAVHSLLFLKRSSRNIVADHQIGSQ